MQNSEKISSNNQSSGSEWDSLMDFSGERSINSRTGKPRTFTEFDLYPKMPGENNEQYGARIRSMHEKIAEYEAAEATKAAEAAKQAEKEAYLASEQGQRESAEEAKFDRLSDKLDQAVREGRMSAEHAERLKEQQLERSIQEIEGQRQDYKERTTTVGTPEEQAQYESWLRFHDAENEQNIEGREGVRREQVEEPKEKEAESISEDAQELVGEESEEIKLDPDLQADLDDMLSDIARWRKLGRVKPEDCDKMEQEVRDRVRTKQIERNEKAKLEAEEQAKLEAEEQAKKETEKESGEEAEAATETEGEKTEDKPAETEKKTEEHGEKSKAEQEAELREQIAASESKIHILTARIEQAREELREVEEARRKPRFSLLTRIFGRRLSKKATATETPSSDVSEDGHDDPNDSVAKESGESESASTNTEEEKSEPIITMAEMTRRNYSFWDDISEEGVEIMADTEKLDDEKAARFESFWNRISDDTKKEMQNYKYKIGLAFRTWLQGRGIIPQDTGQYLNYDNPDNQSRIKEVAKNIRKEYHYWSSIGEKGVQFLESTDGINEEISSDIAEWWGTLDDDTKKRVYSSVTSINSRNGRALREWVKMNYAEEIEI